jgi:hypothetical protein
VESEVKGLLRDWEFFAELLKDEVVSFKENLGVTVVMCQFWVGLLLGEKRFELLGFEEAIGGNQLYSVHTDF